MVIAGRPNAGKSSLLNRLAGYEAAIVTHLPGTTRDVLRERIDIDGMPLHVMDTAGLRESDDVAEQEGVRRAQAELAKCDRALLVIDASRPDQTDTHALLAQLPHGLPVTIIRNKTDLSSEPAQAIDGNIVQLSLSAKTGEGLENLREHLKQVMGFESPDSGTLSARRRHLQALAVARAHMQEGRRRLQEEKAGELLAEELRLAQQALAGITGEFTSDDLLGRIFGSFCIGK